MFTRAKAESARARLAAPDRQSAHDAGCEARRECISGCCSSCNTDVQITNL